MWVFCNGKAYVTKNCLRISEEGREILSKARQSKKSHLVTHQKQKKLKLDKNLQFFSS